VAEHGRYVGDAISEADTLADLRLVLEEALRQHQDAEIRLRRAHDRYLRSLDDMHKARQRVDAQEDRIHRQMLH
jgi:hypothetical protein